MARVFTMLVTYEGSILCQVEEDDVELLENKKPGVYVTIYDVRDVDTNKLLGHEREIECSTIISRLF